jgi:hypothetical protein
MMEEEKLNIFKSLLDGFLLVPQLLFSLLKKIGVTPALLIQTIGSVIFCLSAFIIVKSIIATVKSKKI